MAPEAWAGSGARDPFAECDVAVKISEQPDTDTERGERRRRKLFFNEVKAAGMLTIPISFPPSMPASIKGAVTSSWKFVAGARTLADIAVPGRFLMY